MEAISGAQLDTTAPYDVSAGGGPSSSGHRPVQLTRKQIIGVWAAAALPMAALAWVVAPLVAHGLDGPGALPRALIGCLTVGMAWQFVLVVALVRREQGSLRWPVLRDALWLRRPRSPRNGRVGGRLWLVTVPCVALLAIEEEIGVIPPVPGHAMAPFLESDAGREMFSGSWGWFAVVVVMVVFNTVLGEELLFRGLLLPRMQEAFGRWDWAANGVLFAAYHLHMPWVVPFALLDTFALSYPSRRYRSALMGIAVHSVQSVVILALVLALVLR